MNSIVNNEQTIVNQRLIKAGFENDFSLIRALLTSKVFEPNAQINADSSFIKCVCLSENLKTLKYLLTSPELQEHLDISQDSHVALKHVLWTGNIEILDYILTSPKLKKQANLHFKDSNAKEVIFDFLGSIQYGMYNGKNERFIHVIDYLTGDYAHKKSDVAIYEKIIKLSKYFSKETQEKVTKNILSNFLRGDEIQKEKMKSIMMKYHPKEYELFSNHQSLEKKLNNKSPLTLKNKI